MRVVPERRVLTANTYMFIGNAARTKRITPATMVGYVETLRAIHNLPALTLDENRLRMYRVNYNLLEGDQT